MIQSILKGPHRKRFKSLSGKQVFLVKQNVHGNCEMGLWKKDGQEARGFCLNVSMKKEQTWKQKTISPWKGPQQLLVSKFEYRGHYNLPVTDY